MLDSRPILVRIVQLVYFKSLDLGKENAKNWKEVLKTVPGPFTEKGSKESKKKTHLIVFLGGCTFTEIAAIRFLAQQGKKNLY